MPRETTNGKYNPYKFIIDKEDYNLVNQYCWHKHQDGYLRTCCNHIIDKNGRIIFNLILITYN